MRKVKEITSDEENFRIKTQGNVGFIKRDPVEPEPIGTVILIPFRVVGYDPDCDGSLMARMEHLGLDDIKELHKNEIAEEYKLPLNEVRAYAGLETNWGLYPETGIVITQDELLKLIEQCEPKNSA